MRKVVCETRRWFESYPRRPFTGSEASRQLSVVYSKAIITGFGYNERKKVDMILSDMNGMVLLSKQPCYGTWSRGRAENKVYECEEESPTP